MTQQQEVQSKAADSIEEMLYNSQDQLAAVLPQHISPSRMITIALELVRGDSMLQRCLTSREGKISIVQGVFEASQYGLLLMRNLGHGYLIPFKHGGLSKDRGQDIYLAQFLIGYRGMVHLAKGADDKIAHIYSRIVFPDEDFALEEGTARAIRHRPNLEGGEVISSNEGMLSGFVGAYAMVIYKDSTPPDFEWMPLAEIQKCRNASRAKNLDAPWFKWPEEQTKKTVIRRLCKRLELTPEVIDAIVRDEYRELVQEESAKTRMQMPRRASVSATAEIVSEPEVATPQASNGERQTPTCPAGHGAMVLKPAGKTKAGKEYAAFWSCSKYPECKETAPVVEDAKVEPTPETVPTVTPSATESVDKIYTTGKAMITNAKSLKSLEASWLWVSDRFAEKKLTNEQVEALTNLLEQTKARFQ